MQKRKSGIVTGAVTALGLVAGLTLGSIGQASAKEIVIRIGSGHPPTVVYAGLMKTFFEPELKKAIESEDFERAAELRDKLKAVRQSMSVED